MFVADINILIWTEDTSLHYQSGSCNSCCTLFSEYWCGLFLCLVLIIKCFLKVCTSCYGCWNQNLGLLKFESQSLKFRYFSIKTYCFQSRL